MRHPAGNLARMEGEPAYLEPPLPLSSNPVIVWFREDLRLADNPALHVALAQDQPLICLYVLEDTPEGGRPLGGAAKWWLDKSLRALSQDIQRLGGQLTVRAGDSSACLISLVRETGATGVFWNRRYTKTGLEKDKSIKVQLKVHGVEAQSFNGRLLMEPWKLKTGSGGYYKVFTPFWKALREAYKPPRATQRPQSLKGPALETMSIDELGLHPTSPDWSTGFCEMWTPGEAGALARLDRFLDGPIGNYPDDRDIPGLEDGTSGLSPHLRFGEIGPVQIWRAVTARLEAGQIDEAGAWKFLSEVAWREFCHVLLFHNPDMDSENYNSDFDHMPWHSSPKKLEQWQRGQTGYPIIDAGMRQLWQTGWMHNRVRMVVASFLTKHLMMHWREGEEWFWDTLVDADPASNAANWQWVAGSGADAAPYFRVFNPITQGRKFDPDGTYVRKWCPEIAALPDKVLHAPWEASPETLRKSGVTLGKTYPKPIIDHETGRKRALEAYETLKEARGNA